MATHWYDAHLDLACLALAGRDLSRPPETATRPWPPAAVTFDSLRAGGVSSALFTIFTAPDVMEESVGYPKNDPSAARAAGIRQADWYDDRRADRALDGFAFRLLMEGADPIESPSDVSFWFDRGVVAVGLTWRAGTRYAGGDASGGGLSDAGRDLLVALDAAGIVHDLSHLSQEATDELLEATPARVVASHSNVRALMGGKGDRHLADATIMEIGRRGGVVGLNLFRRFILPGDDPRPSVDDALRHVDHVVERMGHRLGVGLGSDMDGGFSADDMCDGIRRPADLERLVDGLRERGWTPGEIDGFTHANWQRVIPVG